MHRHSDHQPSCPRIRRQGLRLVGRN
jgi:hypothetical protein